MRGDHRSPWGRENIVKGLRIKGWTLARAARHLNLRYHQFYYALKTGSLEAVRDFVSEILHVPPQVLWASRFPQAWGGEQEEHSADARIPRGLGGSSSFSLSPPVDVGLGHRTNIISEGGR